MTSSLNQDSNFDLHSVEANFLKINQERIELTRRGPGEQQARFIELLPLLFHDNNPALPGYINNEVPAGIFEYAVEQSTIKIAKSFFKSYKTTRRAHRIMHIKV